LLLSNAKGLRLAASHLARPFRTHDLSGMFWRKRLGAKALGTFTQQDADGFGGMTRSEEQAKPQP
jgi:hypothetical protein